ncbi:MAG: UDP-N-acetylmuramoyl-tripeptide--D-alanyl-D-alanine ligase [Armatimonadetes bacterium]|nr:UDP-N-acetylmuramoyl-tripeptide--D-alanyl-D-alanine ligase [Armatimonadota bacterium]
MSPRLTVAEVLAATGGRLLAPPGAAVPEAITGVVTDSRTASPGDLFVALRGPRADGHQFVADAITRGAALALVADPAAAVGPAIVVSDTLPALGAIAALHRGILPTTLVGITGSVGKTTTVGFCAQVLSTRYAVARSAESWNAELGVALTLLGLREAHQVAVVEMAMRGVGQIRELVEMARPQIGAVTTIGETHLELLGSREQIASAKAELLEGLPPDGVAVVNADEGLTERLLRDVRCRVVKVGFAPSADVRGADVTRTNGGHTFLLRLGEAQAQIYLPVAGMHQVRNAMMAAAIGWVLGLSPREIASGLGRVSPARMRQQILHVGEIMIIDDAYNASPQSMLAAFDVLAQVGGRRRRVLALGEMRELGPASPEFHRRVGREAAALEPAFLLAVGPTAQWYLDGAAEAGLSPAAMGAVETATDAIPVLRAALRPGDVVLIKGSRAIEMEHVVDALRAREPVSNP